MARLLEMTVVALGLALCCWGYPEGAPSSACSSMQPSHGYGESPSIASSYSVTLSKATYSPGDKITVTVSAAGSARFEGFLVQMRKEVNDGTAMGSWSTTAGQTVCSQASGVTHTSKSAKSSTQMQWTAPSSSAGNVQVWATIVKTLSTWTIIKSSVISITSNPTTTTTTTTTTSTTHATSTSLQPSSSSSPSSTTSPSSLSSTSSPSSSSSTTSTTAPSSPSSTTTPSSPSSTTTPSSPSSTTTPSSPSSTTTPTSPSSTTTPSSPSSSTSTSSPSIGTCGVSKGCFKKSVTCTNDCEYLLSWEPAGDEIKFEMSGISEGYVAVGFSKDKNMGDDNVIVCSRIVGVSHRYQPGAVKPEAIDPSNPTLGFTSASLSPDSAGRTRCSFSRKKVVAVARRRRQAQSESERERETDDDGGDDDDDDDGDTPSGGTAGGGQVDVTHIFDLSTSYYVFLARGDVDTLGEPQMHTATPAISFQKVNFTQLVILTETTPPLTGPPVASPTTRSSRLSGSSSASSTATTTTTTTTTTTVPPGGVTPIDTSTCGTVKACFKSSAACTTACEYALTWQPVGDEIRFELSAAASGYVSVGFSKDKNMGDDNVIMCTSRGAISQRYQAGRVAPELVDADHPYFGLTAFKVGSDGAGRVSCSFARNKTLAGGRRRRAVDPSQVFDLGQAFYVLVARGDLDSNGDPVKHIIAPAVSAQQVTFTAIPTVATGPTTSTATVPPGGVTPIDTSTCGTAKACFKSSAACTTACEYVLTWQPVGDEIRFELSGAASGYVSVGFSKDTKMGDDNVIVCTSRGAISQRYQAGRVAPEPVDADHPYFGLTAFKVGSDGAGRVSCSFARNKTLAGTRRRRAVEPSQVFDLGQTFYLLVARGDVDSNGDPVKHTIAPAVSAEQVNFTATSQLLTTQAGRPLAVAHACLMLIAWVGLASTGILMARFYKPQWASTKLCGEKVWFAIHRTVMLSALLISIVALLLILADLGWTWSSEVAHPVIGMIVLCLAFIQPIMAVLRPHPDGRHRWLFNWAHWFVGTGAHVLSVPAIFLGMRLPGVSLPDSVLYIMIAFVVWHIAVDAILEVNQRYLGSTKVKNVPVAYAIDDKDTPTPPPPDRRGHCLRLAMIILYLIVTCSLLTAMVTLTVIYF